MAKKGWSSKAKVQGQGQGHVDPKKVFFGNIPADLPEAQFKVIVTAKVGEIVEVKAYPPARSRFLISQSCANKAFLVLNFVCLSLAF